jgi:L-iditol 2-dehydrogenase
MKGGSKVTTMKKVQIAGTKKAHLIDVPIPKPREDWVLVRLHVAPLCTEYKAWLKGGPLFGHEGVGEVVEVAQPGKVKKGDRVVVMPQLPCGKCILCISGEYIHCENNVDYKAFTETEGDNTTLAQFIIKPSWMLPIIPAEMPFERACLANCALGPTFGAMQSMKVDAFDTVLITGLGPVGLGGIANAKYRGARVIAVEKEPWRLQRAMELGADLALDAGDAELLNRIKEITGNRGVDAAVECSGNESAVRLCVDASRRKGRIAFVGLGGEVRARLWEDMITKGLTLIGSWNYLLEDYPKVMEVIHAYPKIDKMVSHVYPMSRIQEALETCASQKTAKVLLKPWE